VNYELPTIAPARDRRVRRSRAALLGAAIALVSERGTAAIPLSDIAEAADVSRQLIYQQFGDRDTLLLEAALDLAQRELLPRVTGVSPESPGRARALVMAQHFADYRLFYRAMMTGSCAFALNKALTGLIMPLNRRVVQQTYGEEFDEDMVEGVAMFLTGGAAAIFNTWVVEGADPLDPEKFTDRYMRMVSVVTDAMRRSTAVTRGEEQGQ
jgi:AcrR family transcriptional regulator